jgi:hypothetical protein
MKRITNPEGHHPSMTPIWHEEDSGVRKRARHVYIKPLPADLPLHELHLTGATRTWISKAILEETWKQSVIVAPSHVYEASQPSKTRTRFPLEPFPQFLFRQVT